MNESCQHPPVLNLDPASVGAALIKAVAVSAGLGHASPRFSLQDYVDRSQVHPEGQFVIDALTLSTRETCDRWFGGVVNASGVASWFVAVALGSEAPAGENPSEKVAARLLVAEGEPGGSDAA